MKNVYYSDGIHNIGFMNGVVRMEMGLLKLEEANDNSKKKKTREVEVIHTETMNLDGFFRTYASVVHLYNRLTEKGLIPEEVQKKIEELAKSGEFGGE